MKSKKSYLKIAVLFLVFSFAATVTAAEPALNQYGHIIPEINLEAEAEHFLQDTEYCLNIDGHILKGNSIYNIADGFLTITTLEENVPVVVRIYDLQGELKFEEEFRRAVNFTLSDSRNYSAFYCENEIIRISHQNLSITSYPGINVFALDAGGEIASFYQGKIIFNGIEYHCHEIPRKLVINDDDLIVFTSRNIYKAVGTKLFLLKQLPGTYFDSCIIDDEIYFVTKSSDQETAKFSLYNMISERNRSLIDQVEISREMTRTHDPIPSPLNSGETDYPFLIGNSYGALQEYGQSLYMHPGVDFNGEDYQEVYAVKDGYVKAVITTGGAAYWRIAIANEDTAEECEGYLYAHLNQNSITVAVGDTVYAGDLLGTLYDWQVQEFTHIHFARILDAGEVWQGTWWTTDSPQIDFTNIRDTIPPNLENTLNNDLFAFRNEAGEYLDPDNLSGEFDIISKCQDYCNSPWAQGPYDMWFSIASAFYPDEILYEHPHLVWDMPTDVYGLGQYSFLCVNTFYSRDDVLFSTVGYDYVEAYHIVTNVDDDPVVNELDALQMFDSAQFADGLYMVYVHARDQSLNETVGEMMVTFNNGVDAEEQDIPEIGEVSLSNYPNPFNPETTISLNLTTELTENTELSIFNIRGQKVKTFSIASCSCHPGRPAEAKRSEDWSRRTGSNNFIIKWNGTDDLGKHVPSGVYFCNIKTGHFDETCKMLLLK